jgi:hypothetical protein
VSQVFPLTPHNSRLTAVLAFLTIPAPFGMIL